MRLVERYARIGMVGGGGGSVLVAALHASPIIAPLVIGGVIGALVGAAYGLVRLVRAR